MSSRYGCDVLFLILGFTLAFTSWDAKVYTLDNKRTYLSQLDHGYEQAVQQYDGLLKKYVDENGWVNYAGLETDKSILRDYISSLSRIDFDSISKEEKLATLINAYNAFTLELILEYWNDGQLKSIFDIPEDRRWDDVRWQVGDHTWSLNQIEHEQIRPVFNDPRIHFALVCAAYSCPTLRQEAYIGSEVGRQLEEQAIYVNTHPRWFQFNFDNNIAHLTKLYDWYKKDFQQNGQTILDYVGLYQPIIKEAIDRGKPPKIEWIHYDWRLNDIRNKPNQ